MGWEKGTGFFFYLPQIEVKNRAIPNYSLDKENLSMVKYGGCLQVRLSSFFPKGTYDD